MNPAGMSRNKIDHIATISSQTMAPGSLTPMLRAVVVQAHQPKPRETKIKAACAGCDKLLWISNHEAQPQRLPTVPGALGDKPEPKPKAMA